MYTAYSRGSEFSRLDMWTHELLFRLRVPYQRYGEHEQVVTVGGGFHRDSNMTFPLLPSAKVS